jgi:NhaP-type Na+/H+ or K+/H+ antiporter
MLLAWPGVVVQFLLIALCAKYFFPYNWTWPEAFLFGASEQSQQIPVVVIVTVIVMVVMAAVMFCSVAGECCCLLCWPT